MLANRLSPVIFVFLGTGMIVECLKQEGTSHSSSDLMKINVKMDDSWRAQALRHRLGLWLYLSSVS